MIPMAISLGFGILFATVITLVLVPCLYLIVENVRIFMQKGSGYEPELSVPSHQQHISRLGDTSRLSE